jgi:dimeric dUTPase (all-alpha-NTP-PPase superfamily)
LKISKAAIQSMLELQAGMNAKVDAEWVNAGYPYLRAVVVEGAEAMEHYGWKWWKKQTPDLAQVQMEIVDIWHFVLSAVLIETRGDVDAAREWVEKRIGALEGPDARKTWLLEKEFRLDTLSLIDKLELLIGFSVFRKISIPLIDAILEDCEMSWDELYRQYVGKNVLNFFRQDHGYKTGTYRKHWHDGREDNEHLVEVLAEVQAQSIQGGDDYKNSLYAALQARYAIDATRVETTV